MREDLFEELLDSVREMKAVEAGEIPPGRVTRVTKRADGTVTRRVLSATEAKKLFAKKAAKPKAAANPDIDVAAIRKAFKLPQQKFAAMIGVSQRTLEGWEQGRRKPAGAARMLLRVAKANPQAVLMAAKKV